MKKTRSKMCLSLNITKTILYCILIVLAVSMSFCTKSDKLDFPVLTGPYFGQNLPGLTPELFAPGIISAGMKESGLIFSPDGNELFYTVHTNGMEIIVTSKMVKGKWTPLEVAPFSGMYLDGSPSMHPDGSRLFFHSSRPLDKGSDPAPNLNIWYVDSDGDNWSAPKPVGSPINGDGSAFCPSVTKDGTLYFTYFLPQKEVIMRSKYINGKYIKPEKLPENVNTRKYNMHAFIAPDESFLVIPVGGRKDHIGRGANYYVSFRDEDDNWSELIHLGKSVNSFKKTGSYPSFSADGKYFFFEAYPNIKLINSFEKRTGLDEIKRNAINNPESMKMDIYWADADLIKQLRPKNIK